MWYNDRVCSIPDPRRRSVTSMLYSPIRMSGGESRNVAKIIMGTTNVGTRVSRDEAMRMFDLYWQEGGNAIDTARVYGSWVPGYEGDSPSERVVGEWIRSRGLEKDIFLITKGGHPPLQHMTRSRLGREDLFSDLGKSMDALGIGRIDLYYLHRDDESIPAAKIMDTLAEARERFPIGALGASNWRAARIREANEYAAKQGIAGFSASEIRWSYVDYSRLRDDPTLVTMSQGEYDQYKAMDIAVMAYSSQGTGLFQKGFAPDLSDVPERLKALATDENARRYQALIRTCREENISPSRAVLRYIVDQREINAFALVGCSNAQQLRQSLDAVRE